MVVIAAVDRSERASAIVAEAKELADAFGEPLEVVHVMSPSEFVKLEQTAVSEVGEALQMDEVKRIAQEFAEDAAAGVTDDYRAVGLVGDAANTILDYADDQDARYLVIGGRKRSPAGKVIFGSVAQSVLLNADRPILSVMLDVDNE